MDSKGLQEDRSKRGWQTLHFYKAMLLIMVALFVFVAFPGKASTVRAASKGPYTVTGVKTIDASVFPSPEFFTEVEIKNGATLIVNGNVDSDINVYIRDNGTLIVYGNYSQIGGYLYPSGSNAKVDVSGNLSIINSGFLYNVAKSAEINVGGDFTYDSGESARYNQGIWTVKGDFSTKSRKAGTVTFDTVYLTKDSAKTLTLRDSTSIGSLYLENCNELNVPMYFSGNIYSNANITSGTDTIIKKMEIGERCTVNFNGNLIAEDEVRLHNNAVISVSGDYTQRAGSLVVNGSAAKVNVDKNFSVIESGRLWVFDKAAAININGNLIYASEANSDYSIYGSWTVNGNVTVGNDILGTIKFDRLNLTSKDEKTLAIKEGVKINSLNLVNNNKLNLNYS